MEKKDETMKLLEDLADKLGYKLVKKDKEQKDTFVPEDADKYKEMSSKALTSEIKMIEQDMLKLDAKNEAVRQAVDNFMRKQQSNEVTKVVFDGSRFLSHKLKVYNESQNELRKLKDYLAKILKDVLELEMKDRFEAYNPDFIGEVGNISIEHTPMGAELSVVIKPKLSEKEKTKPIEVE